jgi:RecB family endonuclease NucS
MINRTQDGWEFGSEAALEKFIWTNLKELLGITPFKQQYNCNGELSDILAIDNNKRLVIIELKNTENRYIIQQLTRYYANLLVEKPFTQEIDYSLPVRLIAIAPTYHRHNLIDREHSRLNFELFKFIVTRHDGNFDFLLQELDREYNQRRYTIPYQPIEISVPENIPEPPELLIKFLGACTREEQEGFIQMRSRILTCHQKISEIVSKSSIQYGSGKTRLCAEICFHSKTQKPVLFMWLPIPSAGNLNMKKEKPVIGRLRIWTDGQKVSHVGHVPEGLGKMKTRLEWDSIPLEKRPHNASDFSYTSKSSIPVEIEGYLNYIDDVENLNFWDTLSTLATEKWIEKR